MRVASLLICSLVILISGCASNPNHFDLNDITQAAGKLVAEGKSEFFMAQIPSNASVPSTSSTLTQHLLEAARTKANLAVVGPDNTLNYVILKSALVSFADQSLVGCNIIFVGNEQNFEELKTLAFKAGAEFHATTYPKK